MHAVLRNLATRAPEGYRVSYEVTHHGPTALVTPSLFVEIGSTATEWADPAAGRAVAESILTAVPEETINLIGFGGTHYAVRQTGSPCSRGPSAISSRPGRSGALMRACRAMQSRAVLYAYIDKSLPAEESADRRDDRRCGIVLL